MIKELNTSNIARRYIFVHLLSYIKKQKDLINLGSIPNNRRGLTIVLTDAVNTRKSNNFYTEKFTISGKKKSKHNNYVKGFCWSLTCFES